MSGPRTTLAQQIRDVGRELGMRRSCYPRWVATGKMAQAEADLQLACMEDVYALLKQLQSNSERGVPDAGAPAAPIGKLQTAGAPDTDEDCHGSMGR